MTKPERFPHTHVGGPQQLAVERINSLIVEILQLLSLFSERDIAKNVSRFIEKLRTDSSLKS